MPIYQAIYSFPTARLKACHPDSRRARILAKDACTDLKFTNEKESQFFPQEIIKVKAKHVLIFKPHPTNTNPSLLW